MSKWSKEKLWTNFMTIIQWDNINNWTIINDKLLEEQIPLCKEWVSQNIGYIQTTEARAAFKQFFFSSEVGKTSNAYYWKDRAVEALAALYAKEHYSE